MGLEWRPGAPPAVQELVVLSLGLFSFANPLLQATSVPHTQLRLFLTMCLGPYGALLPGLPGLPLWALPVYSLPKNSLNSTWSNLGAGLDDKAD